MYKINKNLLLLGLLIFASFAQACGGTSKRSESKSETKVDNAKLLSTLGNFTMDAEAFKAKVTEDAKGFNKVEKIKLAQETIEIYKLPKGIVISDEDTQKTKGVPYFEALGGKLVQGKGILKGEKVVKDDQVTGLLREVLDKFGEDAKNKHAKVFVLARLLELQEKVTKASEPSAVKAAVEEFKKEVNKVKKGSNGVLVKVDSTNATLDFKVLSEEDKASMKGIIKNGDKKYTLNKKLFEFIEEQVIKPIEDAIK